MSVPAETNPSVRNRESRKPSFRSHDPSLTLLRLTRPFTPSPVPTHVFPHPSTHLSSWSRTQESIRSEIIIYLPTNLITPTTPPTFLSSFFVDLLPAIFFHASSPSLCDQRPWSSDLLQAPTTPNNLVSLPRFYRSSLIHLITPTTPA